MAKVEAIAMRVVAERREAMPGAAGMAEVEETAVVVATDR
jgi:hypothetical protein